MDPRADIPEHRLRDTLATATVAVCLGGFMTFAEVVHPSLTPLTNALTAWMPQPTVRSVPVPTTSPPASTKPQPAPAKAAPATVPPSISPVATPTATTNSFVHMRAGAGTSYPILTDLDAGTVVQLRSDSNATWQGVTYQGKTGFIFRSYLNY